MLLPLFEEDGLGMGEIARRARLSKQTMTTLVRLAERDRLVCRERDPEDGRALRVYLTERSRGFQPVAEAVVAELDALVAGRLTRAELFVFERSLKGVMEL